MAIGDKNRRAHRQCCERFDTFFLWPLPEAFENLLGPTPLRTNVRDQFGIEWLATKIRPLGESDYEIGPRAIHAPITLSILIATPFTEHAGFENPS